MCFVVPQRGFEPPLPTTSTWCVYQSRIFVGAEGGIRTHIKQILSLPRIPIPPRPRKYNKGV